MAIPSATNAELRMMRLDPVDKINEPFDLCRDTSECGSILGFIYEAPVFERYVLIHLVSCKLYFSARLSHVQSQMNGTSF